MTVSTFRKHNQHSGRKTCCIQGEGVFFRAIAGSGADLILELGSAAGSATVRTTYARFTPISLVRPWTLEGTPRPMDIRSVETAGDELRIAVRAGVFDILDRFCFRGPYLRVNRRWCNMSSHPLDNAAVGTAWGVGGSAAAHHITIPNVLYNNNPSASADRLVPRLSGQPDEALIVEEHRLPIPAVNVEWPEDGQYISLTMLAQPVMESSPADGSPECGSMGVILRPPGVDLVSLSGVVAFNGVKDHIYGAQNRSMRQQPDGYLRMEPGQALEKTIYLSLTANPAEGRGFRTLVSAGWNILQPRSHPCFGIDQTIDLKLNALKGRWIEQGATRGFLCLPRPGSPGNIYNRPAGVLYGWTGQSLRLAWCAMQASARGFNSAPWSKMGAAVLDHYSTAPMLPDAPGCRLGWQNVDDGRWFGSDYGSSQTSVSSRSLGESITSLAECLQFLKDRRMSIQPAWRRALADGVRFLLDAPLMHDGVYPAEFRTVADVKEPAISTAGVTCVTALLAAAGVLDDPALIERACRILDRYAELITMDFRRPFSGATLDASCEDKEAGLFYFLAAVRAFQITRREKYAEQAAFAADWISTFVYHWDVPMRPGSKLADEGFRTSFWPGVSVQNMHLDVFHAPYELFDFGRQVGNERFMRMGLGMIQAWTHGIARHPGHWGYDTPGEQAEQYFQTNYIQGPGGPELWRGGFNPWNPSWIIATVLDAAMKFSADPDAQSAR